MEKRRKYIYSTHEQDMLRGPRGCQGVRSSCCNSKGPGTKMGTSATSARSCFQPAPAAEPTTPLPREAPDKEDFCIERGERHHNTTEFVGCSCNVILHSQREKPSCTRRGAQKVWFALCIPPPESIILNRRQKRETRDTQQPGCGMQESEVTLRREDRSNSVAAGKRSQ